MTIWLGSWWLITSLWTIFINDNNQPDFSPLIICKSARNILLMLCDESFFFHLCFVWSLACSHAYWEPGHCIYSKINVARVFDDEDDGSYFLFYFFMFFSFWSSHSITWKAHIIIAKSRFYYRPSIFDDTRFFLFFFLINIHCLFSFLFELYLNH